MPPHHIIYNKSSLRHLLGCYKAGRKGTAAATHLPRGCFPGGRTWAGVWRWWTCPQWLWRMAGPQGQTSRCSWWDPRIHRRRLRRSPLPAAADLQETEHKQRALSWIHRVDGLKCSMTVPWRVYNLKGCIWKVMTLYSDNNNSQLSFLNRPRWILWDQI